MEDEDNIDKALKMGMITIEDGPYIAGGDGEVRSPFKVQFDEDRSKCMGQIAPVVDKLMRSGFSTNSVISALAAVTVLTLERQRQH